MAQSNLLQAELQQIPAEEFDASCTLGQLAEALLDLGLSIDESNDVLFDLVSSGRVRLTNPASPGSEAVRRIH